MTIIKRSPVTGKLNSMELPITPKQIAEWKAGAFIQDVMPALTDDQREFLISGCTAEDWDKLFPAK